jgi:hypothetical protein
VAAQGVPLPHPARRPAPPAGALLDASRGRGRTRPRRHRGNRSRRRPALRHQLLPALDPGRGSAGARPRRASRGRPFLRRAAPPGATAPHSRRSLRGPREEGQHHRGRGRPPLAHRLPDLDAALRGTLDASPPAVRLAGPTRPGGRPALRLQAQAPDPTGPGHPGRDRAQPRAQPALGPEARLLRLDAAPRKAPRLSPRLQRNLPLLTRLATAQPLSCAHERIEHRPTTGRHSRERRDSSHSWAPRRRLGYHLTSTSARAVQGRARP